MNFPFKVDIQLVTTHPLKNKLIRDTLFPMYNPSPISFEDLVIEQTTALITCRPKDFDITFRKIGRLALEWFNLDRFTLYPNSLIMLNDGKSIWASREGIPKVDKTSYLSGNYQEYFKLLKSKQSWQCFHANELVNNKIDALRALYSEGGRWHGIIQLELFGQNWGALSFSKFSNDIEQFSETDMKRLKLLCDIWLCFWQHSTMTRNLKQDHSEYASESEKLLLLTKKQTAVLSLLAQGYTAKKCAEKLFLSPRTIESHKYRMLSLLGFDNHTELVQFALRNGLGIEQ